MYEKQTWATGDVITEEKLNHIEDGIASSGSLIVNANFNEDTQQTTLDKTWKEIYDAMLADKRCVAKMQVNNSIYVNPIVSCLALSTPGGIRYSVIVADYEGSDTSKTYITTSENGYPVTGTVA